MMDLSLWPGTERQFRFAVLCATNPKLTNKECAIQAGWSEKTASQHATTAKKAAHVKQLMVDIRQAQIERMEVDGDRVLAELEKIAFSDIRELVTVGSNGAKANPSKKWSANAAGAVAAVGETAYGLTIKLHDKLAALGLLAKHYGVCKPPKAGLDEETLKAFDEMLRTLSAKQLLALSDELAKKGQE